MRSLLIALAYAEIVLAAPVSRTWASLGQLNAGVRQSEVVNNDRAEKGEFVSVSTESLTIHTGDGERRILRANVVRGISRKQARRTRNILIGAGVGDVIAVVTDQTSGTYLCNDRTQAARVL